MTAVLEAAQYLLEKAANGELKGIAVVYQKEDGHLGFAYAGTKGMMPAAIVGGLEVLKQIVMETIDIDESNSDVVSGGGEAN